MADFEQAVEKTLRYEGGYTNNPNDPGGSTNFGITLKELQSFGLLYDFDGDGEVTDADIRIMPIEAAKEIYRVKYWKGDSINSQAVAEKSFDIGVNMGINTAGKYLQQACVNLGSQLSVDGIVGDGTVDEVNNQDETALMTEICRLQENHYWNIVQHDIETHANERRWPANLQQDVLVAVTSHNVDLVRTFIRQLKSSGLKPGNIIFIPGWIPRARDRFGI